MKSYLHDSPFKISISFNKLLEMYEEVAKNGSKLQAENARQILEMADAYPELRHGFSDLNKCGDYKEQIEILLQDSFSPILSNNEIKTAGLPFDNNIFKSSQRFKKILKDAGDGYDLQIRNVPEEQMYILQCAVILSFYYKKGDLAYKKPLFYDIPDKNGVLRHYRIQYNADFMEFLPTDKAKTLTDKDIEELLDGFDNLELWKEKFPPNSWIASGFVISNIFDVTIDDSISDLKTTLLEQSSSDAILLNRFQEIFRSIFNISDLQTGFSGYDEHSYVFEKLTKGLPSYLLWEKHEEDCDTILCEKSSQILKGEKKYFSISDIEKAYKLSQGAMPYRALYHQGYKSAILIPITNEKELLGVLELVSKRKYELNSINANKLNDVLPYITAAVIRNKNEHANAIEAIIQNEYTSIHESVKWKFVKEVKHYLEEKSRGNIISFKDIVFKDVFPLYGQIDIKNSSIARNKATQKDLITQLEQLSLIFDRVTSLMKFPIYEEYQFRVLSYLEEVKKSFKTGTEQIVMDFLKEEIHPSLEQIAIFNNSLAAMVAHYEKALDPSLKMIYDQRRKYDDAVTSMNKKMARILDEKQVEAQHIFPHYFERYKTDGVDHTMYIGNAIAPTKNYSDIYLQNLKLWQLVVMCAMENAYYELKPSLEVPLDVTSLILVHSSPLTIKFRMDEKRFDVDGTYNARYEIIKKRIDKAHIKGTNERITKPGKITIVYSQKKEEEEYLRYIRLLQAKGMLYDNVEINELEELQGVIGLKAMSVEILYTYAEGKSPLTFNDLMKVIAK
ncbi:GAF domain-containing protein [Galbibacter pacificus]|uniref:GAF domain-containing protein n=1 Tax=Galbibacter pacificus TaxID=2996052 RepID=A0ABT6FPQ3_9FLAO|nr:GAF domain-containing protein [Galbibacter pacificus]MDG3582319.1 GAF domain-containing protein [Galbibacter pacificus]MDG3585205.1 GAF domain-containing protein [Galbibacter pacificus]